MGKVHYDLTNVHVAKRTVNTDGSVTFGDPKRFPGAVSMDLAAQGETVKFRADAMDYYVSNSNNGYDGDVTFAMVPDWFREEYLGDTLSETDKVLVENAEASGEAFALMYEFKGDKYHRRHVLYNCVASRPNIKGENKDSQKQPDTEALHITASPQEDGMVKASTTPETSETTYKNWYKKVWMKDGDLNSVE